MFTQKFIDEAKALYPDWHSLHEAIEKGSGIVGRYLDDAQASGISASDVLRATSLEELKEKAELIKRKEQLYADYRSGRCYENEDDKRKQLGCPRLYGQSTNDLATLDAFECLGVGYIPSCPKFKTGECWKKFDDLGLALK